jgi:tetratricopeptide (TPR) repeat protein
MRSFLISAFLLALMVSPARAEPRPIGAAAKKELDRARALFDAGDYTGAVAAIDAGFAIDPHPDFLYARGQAQRKLGDCTGAVASFRAFLASSPPERAAEAARTNIERCEAAAAAQPLAPRPPPSGGELGATTTPPPAETPPWYRDAVSGFLAAGSAVALGAGVTFFLIADGHVDRTRDADVLDDYESERSAVTRNRTIGAISLAVGGALAAGAVLRYATRPGRSRATVRPSGELGPEGAVLGLAGEF